MPQISDSSSTQRNRNSFASVAGHASSPSSHNNKSMHTLAKMAGDKEQKLKEALEVLTALGFPRAQRNDRSAICLLALLNLTPSRAWKGAESPLIGIRGMLDFARKEYDKQYAEN